MTNEVDSFNPFNGIEVESYEAWALMYDYMISYSDKDMSPQPGLAESWETSDDGLTWTFDIRSGVTWTDGEPLTAADIAYTYNRILDGGPESATWGSYLTSVQTITAPDDTTVVLELDEPNAVLPLLPMPIIPEHIWSEVDEQDVKSYSNEPESEEEPVVGSGPFELVEGEAGGNTYRFVRNEDYWDGTANIGEVVMQVYRSEDTLVQALKAGDIDFAEGVTPLQIKALQGDPTITAQAGDSPGFDEIAFNVGSVNLKTGEPMGDPNPAVLDKDFRFALTFAIDREQIAEKVYQGAAEPAGNIIPPAYETYQWEAPPDAYAYDPEKTRQAARRGGVHRRRRRVAHDAGRLADREAPAVRALGLGDLPGHDGVLKEWLADVQIDSEVTAMESSKLTNVILDGEYDTFDGAGSWSRIRLDASYFTCDQRGSWSDSWYCDRSTTGCTSSRTPSSTRTSEPRSSSDARDAL
jgi:peptide/nickel transport system substrate-binding protein